MCKIAKLKLVAEEVGGRYHGDYSGRGMYGKQCASIYCSDATECIEAAAERGIKGARQDNMGLGWVVYWPNIQDDSSGDADWNESDGQGA